MDPIKRREALGRLAAVPFALRFAFEAAEVEAAQKHVEGALAAAAKGEAYKPKFFTPHEWETVKLLVDLIIPKDERSGSATDAGVPEFMDFIMTDPLENDRGREWRQTGMRGGLAWLDAECQKRFQATFLESSDPNRHTFLDEISKATSEDDDEDVPPGDLRVRFRHGPSFFSSFRDLTASGFWSSKMGVQDLGYIGNTYVAEWKGCPPEALRKLGLEA
jgi:hypothetical protein